MDYTNTPETHPLQQTPEAGRSGKIQVLLQDPTPTPKHSGENFPLSRVLTADNVCAQASALKYGGYQIGYFIWGKAAWLSTSAESSHASYSTIMQSAVCFLCVSCSLADLLDPGSCPIDTHWGSDCWTRLFPTDCRSKTIRICVSPVQQHKLWSYNTSGTHFN